MNEPPLPITGGCLCGAVRYESSTAPTEGYYCHCTMCQKNYGGLFMASLKFTGGSFSIVSGQLKYYRSSDIAERGFCADCGSPIVFRYDGAADIWVLLGSLDRPGDWPLTASATWGVVKHVCVESKVSWLSIADGVEQRSVGQMVTRNAALDGRGADRTPVSKP
jgi:hypothetical protein